MKQTKTNGREYSIKDLYPFKNCISSTQFLDYEKSPQDFYVRWVLGVKQVENGAMKVGRIFSDLFADRKYDYQSALLDIKQSYYIPIFKKAIRLFPELPKRQCEYELRPKFKGFQLRATLDGKTPKMIIENKTGKTEWTQERADLSDQITFQAFCWYLKYKKPPEKIMLNWVDCRRKDPQQPVVTFYTHRNIEQLKYFGERVENVINNIKIENWGS